MRRITSVVMLIVLSAAVGCEQMHMRKTPSEPMSMAEMKKPSQPVQMRQLDPFIGTWEGTAEMVAPQGTAPSTQPVEPPRTYKGGGTNEWALDGMAMKSTSWHEMPDGQKSNYVEYVTWDPRARKFKSYFVSDWGETGTGWMWAEPDGQRFHWTAKGSNARGELSSMSGSSSIVDKNTMKWDFVEDGPMGRMQMRGTSVRTDGNK